MYDPADCDPGDCTRHSDIPTSVKRYSLGETFDYSAASNWRQDQIHAGAMENLRKSFDKGFMLIYESPDGNLVVSSSFETGEGGYNLAEWATSINKVSICLWNEFLAFRRKLEEDA